MILTVYEPRQNLMRAAAAGEGLPVAILNRNEPAFLDEALKK